MSELATAKFASAAALVYASMSLRSSPLPPLPCTYASRWCSHAVHCGCSAAAVAMIASLGGVCPAAVAMSNAFCMHIITISSVFSSFTSKFKAF